MLLIEYRVLSRLHNQHLNLPHTRFQLLETIAPLWGKDQSLKSPGVPECLNLCESSCSHLEPEAYHLGTRAIFQNTSDIKGYPIPNNNPPPQVAAKPAIEKGRELLQLMSSGGTLQKKSGEIIARITFDMTL